MIALGAALAYAGFAGIALAMGRHHEQVLGSRRIPPWRRRILRGGGWSLLGASLLPVVQVLGWAQGTVLWTGILTAAAMSLAMLLCYAPRAALVLAAAPIPAGLLLLLSHCGSIPPP